MSKNMYDVWDNGDRHEIRQQFAEREKKLPCTRCGKPVGDEGHIHTCTPTTREEKIVQPGIYERAEEAYTAAKQRGWVGLTEAEKVNVAIDCGCADVAWMDFADTIEAKLKEKNA